MIKAAALYMDPLKQYTLSFRLLFLNTFFAHEKERVLHGSADH